MHYSKELMGDITADLIGERIKIARMTKGYSCRDLARVIGVNSECISTYENGKVTPTVYTLRKISIALNVSSDYFLDIKADQMNRIILELVNIYKKGNNEQENNRC